MKWKKLLITLLITYFVRMVLVGMVTDSGNRGHYTYEGWFLQIWGALDPFLVLLALVLYFCGPDKLE